MPADVLPLSIKRDGDAFRIEWSDGVAASVPFLTLRNNCPCATCNDERTKPADPFRVLSAREVSAGLPVPVAMKAVGHYAYQITWNDGHDAGIFTLDALRRLGHPATPPKDLEHHAPA